MATLNVRVQRAVDTELAALARGQANIDAAHERGQISAHDCEERKARAEQWTTNRIAYLTGEPRPPQRQQLPLDDPDAGSVG
jgi:membrane-bound lytic murein transglycosylase MltF